MGLVGEDSYVDSFGGTNESQNGIAEEPIAPVLMRTVTDEDLRDTLSMCKLNYGFNWIVALKDFRGGAGLSRSL